jgi:hypothetical protein
MDTLPLIGIDFDEDRHVYSLRGMKMPSVTQIMEPMTLMLYAGIPYGTLSQAADRGTRAHEQISNYVMYGIEEYDEDTAPYIEAYKEFHQGYDPLWLASEYRIYHKQLRYAGTVDLIGYVEPDSGEGVDVVDIKCTSQFHGIMLATQVSAYAEALKSHGIKIRRRYGLQLQKSGKPRFEEVKDNYKLFIHCLAITNAMAQEVRP